MSNFLALSNDGNVFRLVSGADGEQCWQRLGRELSGHKPVNADELCILETDIPDWAVDCWTWTSEQLYADSIGHAARDKAFEDYRPDPRD